MSELGFDILPGEHPIVPVMVGDEVQAARLAEKLVELGVYAVSFSFPVVPRGTARIRTQMSAAHAREDIDFAVEQFARGPRRARAVGTGPRRSRPLRRSGSGLQPDVTYSDAESDEFHRAERSSTRRPIPEEHADMQKKITTFLTFDGQAAEAVALYTSVFPDSRILSTRSTARPAPGRRAS